MWPGIDSCAFVLIGFVDTLCGMAFAKRRRASDQDCEELLGSAYVSLFHGVKTEFYLYALVLGHQLQLLDPHRKWMLMMGPLDNTFYRKSLEMFWSLTDIDLIDAEHVDKSGSKQHKQVFSKLRLFELPYRKIPFLDLDAVLQRRAPPKFLT